MGIALKHLSESDRIRIARELFTVKKEDEHKGELHGLCPVHGEKNPSFSYNYRTDLYHCFSCGDDGDLCGLWSKVKGYSKEEGFKAFCRTYSIGEGGQGHDCAPAPPPKQPEGPKITPDELEAVFEKFQPLPEAKIRDLEEKRKWTRQAIEILDLRLQTQYLDKSGSLKEVANPDRIAIPVRDAQGKLQNIRLYRPGGGQYKIMSWAKSTGSARLFPASPLEISGPVLICEGEPDTIAAISQGFTAITQTSKTKTWSKEHLEPLKGLDVVVCYDADAAGQQYALYAALSLLEVAASVRILSWPDTMGRTDGVWPEDHGEDMTDYFAKHAGTKEGLLELMAKAKAVTKPLQKASVDELIDSMGFPAEGKKYAVNKVKEDFWALAMRTGSAGEIKPEDLPGPLKFFARGVNDRLSFKSRLLADHILRETSLMFDPSTGILYKWSGRIWEPYDEEHIGSLAIRLLEDESQKSKVEDAIYQVKRLCTIPHGRKVNDQADWICIENGMLNLRTTELREHDREFLSTFLLPVTYDPESGKTCKRFLEYLWETVQTKEAIMQLQEYSGYCLTTSTAFEKCLLLLGPGADGKSKFLGILRELVGRENCAAVSFPDLEDQFQRSSLYGKLLNISTEVGSEMIDSQFFKAIVSGDPINAAFKHRDSFEFCPTCKLAFAGNRLPRSSDNSDGYYRRFLAVRFKRQFLEDADPFLFDKLKAELSEIFVWAVEGLQRLWEQNGFTIGDEMSGLMKDFRRSNNPVLGFIEDRCVLGEEFEIPKKDLYKEYKTYCAEGGYKVFSMENFFREVYTAYNYLQRYRPRIDGERLTCVKGIKLDVSKF